jgi:hypothetical protein
MAGKPDKKPMATSADSARELLGEPRFTEDMTLLDRDGSVRIGIPISAVKFLAFQAGETQEVEVYDDGVFIPASGGRNE